MKYIIAAILVIGIRAFYIKSRDKQNLKHYTEGMLPQGLCVGRACGCSSFLYML